MKTRVSLKYFVNDCSNNDTKVPLKQITRFLGNSTYKISLKKTSGGWENFCPMTIDIYSFMQILPVFTPFLPVWGNFSRISSFVLLLVDRSVV